MRIVLARLASLLPHVNADTPGAGVTPAAVWRGRFATRQRRQRRQGREDRELRR